MNAPSGSRDVSARRRLGPWGWFALCVLGIFLVSSVWYAIYAWGRMGGVGISPMGWAFLVAGIVLTFLVGAGLMALLFYSSRTGRDI